MYEDRMFATVLELLPLNGLATLAGDTLVRYPHLKTLLEQEGLTFVHDEVTGQIVVTRPQAEPGN